MFDDIRPSIPMRRLTLKAEDVPLTRHIKGTVSKLKDKALSLGYKIETATELESEAKRDQ